VLVGLLGGSVRVRQGQVGAREPVAIVVEHRCASLILGQVRYHLARLLTVARGGGDGFGQGVDGRRTRR